MFLLRQSVPAILLEILIPQRQQFSISGASPDKEITRHKKRSRAFLHSLSEETAIPVKKEFMICQSMFPLSFTANSAAKAAHQIRVRLYLKVAYLV